MDGQIALFALNASGVFGEQVSRQIGIALSPHEEREFEDGEHKARPLTGVCGCDVYVMHSLYSDQKQSGNDKLCRLLFFIGALRDAGAERVTAVVPYLAYSRKDRKTKSRDPVTTRYVATLFEAVGSHMVMTLDVHNLAAFQNAFRCATEHLEANHLFVDHFMPLLSGRPVTVFSPDAGGIKRAEQFRQLWMQASGEPAEFAFMEKYRSEGKVTGSMVAGEVAGRDVVIIDDLISSGATLARAADACRARGAGRIFAAATHGLFMGAANEILAGEALDGIVITDSVDPWRLGLGPAKEKLTVLGCAPLFAQSIRRLHEGDADSQPFASQSNRSA